MRFLVIIGSLDVGGCERHLLSVLPRLAKETNHHISVLPILGFGELTSQFRSSGIVLEERHIQVGQRLENFLRRCGWFTNVCRRCFRIFMILKAFFLIRSFDGYKLCYLPHSFVIGGLASLINFDTRIILFRRSRNFYQAENKFVSFFESFLIRFSRYAVGNSEVVCSDLINEGFPEDKVKFIPNGVDWERIPVRTAGQRAQDDRIRVVLVGNIIPYKGYRSLILALMSSEALGHKFEFDIIGEDRGELAALVDLVAVSNANIPIRFLGSISEPQNCLCQYDAGMSVSSEEGSSNALLEMAAAGLCLIATNVGDVKAIILKNMSGIILDDNSVESIRKGLEELANCDLDARGKCARKLVIENRSLDATVNSYIEFLSGLK